MKLFDVWDINFMGLCVSSYENKYIFVVVDYVSKLVEVVALPTNEGECDQIPQEMHFHKIWNPTGYH